MEINQSVDNSPASRRRGDGVEDERAVNLIPTQSSNAYEAMTSRIGVPRLTRMTVISPVFLLCARTVIMPSSPDDGAAADGRLLVDVTEFVLLVTEFLLSFVGTLAGLKLSSDIAACIQRAQRFQSFLGYGVTRGYIAADGAAAAWWQRVRLWRCSNVLNPTAPLIQRQPINWTWGTKPVPFT